MNTEETEAIREARDAGILRDLRGAEFVLTGIHSMTRVDMTDLIKALNGRVAPRVSGSTRALVCTDGMKATVKLQEAARLGALIMTESSFITYVNVSETAFTRDWTTPLASYARHATQWVRGSAAVPAPW